MAVVSLAAIAAIVAVSQFRYAPHIFLAYVAYCIGALLVAKLKEDAKENGESDSAAWVAGSARRSLHRLGHATGCIPVVGAYVVFFVAWGGLRLATIYFALFVTVCRSELLYPLVVATLRDRFHSRLYARYALPTGIVLFIAGLGALARLAR